jgi:SAM-dependent methyltransferase
LNPVALTLLCCPICRSSAPDLTETADALTCQCGHRFPIRNGIADFTGDDPVVNDSPVYDVMWEMHERRAYPEIGVATYVQKFQRFAQLPGDVESYFRDRLVLDAGCGEGRFTYLASALGARHVIAADYSLYALERARQQTGNPANVTFIRANLLQAPFLPDAFDLAYSFGVVHHTPSSERSFESVRTAIKPGGYLAIYVYKTRTLPLIAWPMRPFTTRMDLATVRKLCVFFGWDYEDLGKPTIPIGRWFRRLGRLDVLGIGRVNFEFLSTRYLREHSRLEVVRWFEQSGMEVLASTEFVSVSGRRATEGTKTN